MMRRVWWIAVVMVCLMGNAWAQEGAVRGDRGTIVGRVREVTDEFVLIGRAGELPRRYAFGAANKAVGAMLRDGEWVEVKWVYEDRLRIEGIRETTEPVAATGPAPQEAAPVAAGDGSAAPSDVPALQPVTVGERVNAMVDNLAATGERLLQLPLFMLLMGAGVLGIMAAGISLRLTKAAGGKRVLRAGFIGAAIVVVLGAAVMADRRVARLEEELRGMRALASAGEMAKLQSPIVQTASQVSGTQPAAATGRAMFFRQADAEAALAKNFPGVVLKAVPYNAAIDYVMINTPTPLLKAYVAVVDLRQPGVGITLGTRLDVKTLTTQFARENKCTLAINGEAGLSPAPGSGLGTWRGFLMDKGKLLMPEQAGNPRPFLSFDAQNRASVTAMVAKSRTLPPDAYKVIWGRLDALVHGEVQTQDMRNRQPRTGMGVSRDGTLLYLLVVDGRQPRASVGATRAEVGQLLQAFGAYEGMLCDEGGSSCMYLEKLGGIVNVPSDGQERVTYTHFGVTVGGVGGP